MSSDSHPVLLIVVNVDWFFCSHRLPVALAAKRKGFQVHIATTLTDPKYKLMLMNKGLHIHELFIDRSAKNIFRLASNFLAICHLYSRLRPSLIHLVTIQPVLLGGLAARALGFNRVVFAISGLGHVFVANSLFAKVRRYLIKLLYRFALGINQRAIIFQNEEDRVAISSFCSITRHQCYLFPGSGVDLSVFTFTPLPSGVPVVQMASRLLATKGVREFVESAAILAKRGVTAEFQLIGEPDIANPAAIPISEIDDWSRKGLVNVIGYREDLHLLMQKAHVFCLPSYREGLPKVVCEASASGRPVVTTDVPGCRDSIHPGETGLLVPPRNPVALADAIEYLLDNRNLMAEMGIAARNRAELIYDVDKIAGLHVDLYCSLLDEP